jgi:hypothetical protein
MGLVAMGLSPVTKERSTRTSLRKGQKETTTTTRQQQAKPTNLLQRNGVQGPVYGRATGRGIQCLLTASKEIKVRVQLQLTSTGLPLSTRVEGQKGNGTITKEQGKGHKSTSECGKAKATRTSRVSATAIAQAKLFRINK